MAAVSVKRSVPVQTAGHQSISKLGFVCFAKKHLYLFIYLFHVRSDFTII